MSSSVRWLDTFLSQSDEELERQAQSQIRNGRIPVLIDRQRPTDWEPPRHKFASSPDRPFLDVVTNIRRHYYPNAKRALAFMCESEIVLPSTLLGELHNRFKTKHGFLVITVLEETVFG